MEKRLKGVGLTVTLPEDVSLDEVEDSKGDIMVLSGEDEDN